MAYTEKCTGTYIGQFTMYNPVRFNKALNDGCTIREATKQLKNSEIVLGAGFYPIYSYTVDGVEYLRASYRLHEHFGRSAGSANMWMKGTRCIVCYDPENPGDAVVEEKSVKAEAKDVAPGSMRKPFIKWVLIAFGIFAVLGIVQIVMHSILFMRR